MRNAIIPTFLRTYIRTQHRTSNPRTPKRIQRDTHPLIPQLCRSKRRDRTAQRVPRGRNLVARVRSGCRFHGVDDSVPRVCPRPPEPGVCGAPRAEVCGDKSEVEVREPVVDGLGAAEGDDDYFAGVVEGDEAGHVGKSFGS